MSPGNGVSILDCVRMGIAVDINSGTFGDGGGQVVDWPIEDVVTLATAGISSQLFLGGKGANLSNVNSNIVPEGERWDLTSLGFYLWTPTGASFTEVSAGTYQLAIAWIQSASYYIQLNQTTVAAEPLYPYFGHMQGALTAATPVLAMTSERPAEKWTRDFNEHFPLMLQSKVQFKMFVQYAALPAGLNGFQLGCRFGRFLASKSP